METNTEIFGKCAERTVMKAICCIVLIIKDDRREEVLTRSDRVPIMPHPSNLRPAASLRFPGLAKSNIKPTVLGANVLNHPLNWRRALWSR